MLCVWQCVLFFVIPQNHGGYVSWNYFHFMDAIGCHFVTLFSRRVNACTNCWSSDWQIQRHTKQVQISWYDYISIGLGGQDTSPTNWSCIYFVKFSIGFDIVHLCTSWPLSYIHIYTLRIPQQCNIVHWMHISNKQARLHVRYQIRELIGEICVHGGGISISHTLIVSCFFLYRCCDWCFCCCRCLPLLLQTRCIRLIRLLGKS